MATYGEIRRKGGNRRRRVRYDRIALVAGIFLVIILVIVGCTKGCGGDDKEETSSIVPTEAKSDTAENAAANSSQAGSLENYSTVEETPEAVNEGNLVLVNNSHEYKFPSATEESLVHVYDAKSDSYQVNDLETDLTTECVTQLNSMMDAFRTETNLSDIMLISGYRTKEFQDGLNSDGVTDIKGGFSDYHTGLSFDIGIYPEDGSSYYYSPDGDHAWLNENCANYGFVVRFPEGKENITGAEACSYTFRYVGVPHAICMKENGLCLEEYIDFVKSYTYDGDHLQISAPDKKYEVYYVPADPSANTQVPVPSGKTYTVSGNNSDGFIVTVEV